MTTDNFSLKEKKSNPRVLESPGSDKCPFLPHEPASDQKFADVPAFTIDASGTLLDFLINLIKSIDERSNTHGNSNF